jgi:hypothetical protein
MVVAVVVVVMLLGAASAEAVPSVTFSCTPAPQDCSGWYRSNVSIAWTVLPSTATRTGCQSRPFTADTAGTTEFCRATDGSSSVTVEVTIRLDKTPPVVTGGTPARGADGNGWYTRPVQVRFSGRDQTSGIATCTSPTYGGPDAASASLQGRCTDNAGNVSTLGYGLRYDATAPVISRAVPDYPPTATGWFNRPVGFDIQASDATSGVADCSSLGYGGPDSASVSLSGTCRDRAGNSASRSFGLKYDATDPEVRSVEAARAPDTNGWYTRPLPITFSGRDQLSGVDTCTSVTYSGPDSGAASVPGTCRDRAGNVSTRFPFSFKYDATAPAVTSLNAAPGDRSVALSWRTSADADSVEVARTPGVDPEPATVLFRGPGTTFVDGRVENGVRYAYVVRVRDPAGNAGSASVFAVPVAAAAPAPPVLLGAPLSVPGTNAPRRPRAGRRLLGPPRGAVVRPNHPPLLRWTPVPGAEYYNVQLFRGGRKILTVWPTRPRYQLKRRWTYRGEVRRLVPGRYRWLVWPGFGRRSRADYGRRIGPSTFRVRRLSTTVR